MILDKLFDVGLHISDPNNYAKTDNYIMKELTQLQGKIKGCSYILKILNIIKKSSCKVDETGTGIVSVRFLAKVVDLEKNSIIPDAKIFNLTLPPMILGSSITECKTILSIKSDNPELIKVGQIVPVIITESFYVNGVDKITGSANILTCVKTNHVYKIKGILDKDQMDKHKQIINNINLQLEKRNELIKTKNDNIMFFENLLYTYNNNPNIDKEEVIKIDSIKNVWKGPKKINTNDGEDYNIIDLLNNILNANSENVTGYWGKKLTDFSTSPIITKYKTYTYQDNSILINVDEHFPDYPFELMLSSIYNFLNVINYLSENFDENKIKEYKNIWMLMDNAKIKYI